MFEPLQNYVNLVSGASRASRERATAAARGLLAQAGLQDAATDAQERISKLADDILNASRANREMLENVIGAEVEKAANRLGFARVDQVEDLQAQVVELRLRVDRLVADRPPAADFATAPVPPVKKAAAKKGPAPFATGPVPPTKKAAAKKSSVPPAGDASVARKQTIKKSPAAKAAARRSPAQKAAARQSPATTAAQQTSPAERAAQRTVAPPSPLDSSGDVSS